MKWVLAMILVIGVLPGDVSAGNFIARNASVDKTWEDFNTAVNKKSEEIMQIVFGPITKILGVLGVAYGVISMIATASPKPLITFGGIGLLISIIPYFVDIVFGATLPGM